jgi:hypothetical protein
MNEIWYCNGKKQHGNNLIEKWNYKWSTCKPHGIKIRKQFKTDDT